MRIAPLNAHWQCCFSHLGMLQDEQELDFDVGAMTVRKLVQRRLTGLFEITITASNTTHDKRPSVYCFPNTKLLDFEKEFQGEKE